MSRLIIPWLATVLFGFGVFVVGRILQVAERRERERRKSAKEREDLLAKTLAQARMQEGQNLGGVMAAAAGSQGQRSGRAVN